MKNKPKNLNRKKRFALIIALAITGIIGLIGASAGISHAISKAEVKPVQQELTIAKEKTSKAIENLANAADHNQEDIDLNYKADSIGDIAWRETAKANNIIEKLEDRTLTGNEITNARTFYSILQKQVEDASKIYGNKLTKTEHEELSVILTSNTESITKIMGAEDHDCDDAFLKSEIFTLVPEIDGRTYKINEEFNNKYEVGGVNHDGKNYWINNFTINTELPAVPRKWKEIVTGRRIETSKETHLIFGDAGTKMKDRFIILTDNQKNEEGRIFCNYTDRGEQLEKITLTVGQEIILPITCSLTSRNVNFSRVEMKLIDGDSELPEELSHLDSYEILDSLEKEENANIDNAKEIARELIGKDTKNLSALLNEAIKKKKTRNILGESLGGGSGVLTILIILLVLGKTYWRIKKRKKLGDTEESEEEKKEGPPTQEQDETMKEFKSLYPNLNTDELMKKVMASATEQILKPEK